MDIKNLFDDEEAVSPVIGVILMVAITVILAAVIGAFVIGIGEDQEVQPTASFNIDFESDKITVSHSTGDTIEDPDSLNIVIDGESEDWIGHDGEAETDEVTSVSAGISAEIFADDGTSGEAPQHGDTVGGEYVIEDGTSGDFNEAIELTNGGSEDATFDYDGQSVRIVWSSETGDSSATLSSQDAPN